MDESIKRTKKEIDDVLKKGDDFVKAHPQSMFGDDNVQPFEEFKEIMRMAKEGTSAALLRAKIKKDYENEEDERMHLENMADDAVDWLEGLTDEDPY